MTELNNLPPGWDTKVDRLTGKRYYINHNTKSTTWEDPRNKHRGNGVQGEYIPLQDIKPSRNNTSLRPPQQTQESTLTVAQETDESVAKISSMFPTVSDTHIRLLLKKYMKSIFPKAEETVILDVLTSNENNIQKASDTLKGMGYERRDPVKLLQQQEAEAKREEEEKARQNEAVETIEIPLIPKIKTPEEKDRIKISLQEQYKDVTEQVITIALESVEYDETRACQILQIMVQEDADNKAENAEIKDTVDSVEEEPSSLQPQINIPISQSRHSFKSLVAEKSEMPSKDKNIPRIVIEENCNKMALGANPNYAKGPKDELLLLDYAPWDGPDENLRCGPKKGLAKGPNKNNLSNREYKSFGPNPDLRKGAKVGLAKGSMFKQFRNIVIGESRGK